MKKRIAKLLRALADRLAPMLDIDPSSLKQIETGYINPKCLGVRHSYSKKDAQYLNFDYLRSMLAHKIGEQLLNEKMILFSIDSDNGVYEVRAEVYAARPLDSDNEI